MKNSLACYGVLIASALPFGAQAADMPRIAPLDVAVQQAATDWSGAYAGVNAGYTLGEFGTFTPAAGASTSYDGDGAIGGFQIGYNKQLGRVVIGVEGDIQASGVDGSTSLADAPTQSDLNWFSTLRGRIGYAFDKTLVYGTAGAAVGGIESGTPGGGSEDQTAWGLAAGAGIERELTKNLTLKAEYLYLDLEEKGFETAAGDQNTEWDGHVMRLGANFKF
ncbi:outer membrane protein [Terrihabitans rhizophilus]|uniref:Outer membrane protein n=1 Tax=Terrihabitans rhizophilus TaxID=3092662 RepID=A0ABU4RQ71_9HYPH|nr:outer membrane protein [Terrihabitans sp. PJ23]MDX6807012.1 outer membrane protein [Terrihabitans sp. PJ23]